jgi:hypothetical protein
VPNIVRVYSWYGVDDDQVARIAGPTPTVQPLAPALLYQLTFPDSAVGDMDFALGQYAFGPQPQLVPPIVTTTDGSPTVLAGIPMGQNELVMLQADIVGRQDSGAQTLIARMLAGFKRGMAATTQVGATSMPFLVRDNANWNAAFAIDADNTTVNIVVTGDVGETVHWNAGLLLTNVT